MERGPYSADQHQHGYAVWCAARAATRGLRGGTNRGVRIAIEACPLPEMIRAGPALWPRTSALVDVAHERWCADVLASLHDQGMGDARFGRAAKIVSIYLKTRVVCGPWASHGFAGLIHPPIDAVLLQALARDSALPVDLRARCRAIRWTRLDAHAYAALIDALRAADLHAGGFWRLERYWSGDLG